MIWSALAGARDKFEEASFKKHMTIPLVMLE
jgi:hypothetical protein